MINPIVAIILCLPSLAFAQDYPTSQSLYVNDFAGLIDAETETRLTATLKNLQKNQGIEMTVVTIGSVSDYGSTQSVPDFTTGLFNAWGVGNATRNDGIVFLTSLKDREMFIGLGSGYSPVYDDRMDRVFEYHVKPYFVKEDYAQGIEVGVLETIKRTSTNFVDASAKPSTAKRLIDNIIHALVIGFITLSAVFVIGRGFHKKFMDASYRWRPCPNCANRSLTRTREVTQTPTFKLPGSEQVIVGCSNCEYKVERSATLSRISSVSNSSSRGGRGGGSSSGGGGGGRW
jgi:uncharacterized protein